MCSGARNGGFSRSRLPPGSPHTGSAASLSAQRTVRLPESWSRHVRFRVASATRSQLRTPWPASTRSWPTSPPVLARASSELPSGGTGLAAAISVGTVNQNIVEVVRPRGQPATSRNFARMPSRTRLSSISRLLMFARRHNSAVRSSASSNRARTQFPRPGKCCEGNAERASKLPETESVDEFRACREAVAAPSLVTQRQSIISDLAGASVQAQPSVRMSAVAGPGTKTQPKPILYAGVAAIATALAVGQILSSCACDAGTDLSRLFTRAMETSVQRLRWRSPRPRPQAVWWVGPASAEGTVLPAQRPEIWADGRGAALSRRRIHRCRAATRSWFRSGRGGAVRRTTARLRWNEGLAPRPSARAGRGVAIATGPRPDRLSSTGWAVVPALLLLAVPFWEGTAHSRIPRRVRPDDRRRLACRAGRFAAGWAPRRRVVSRRIGDNPGRPRDVGVPHGPSLQCLLERRKRTSSGRIYFFAFGKENRPTGSLYDPISLGNILALACPLALVLAATARTATARLLALVAVLLIGIGLTLSLSRMSWIGAVAGAAVAIVLLPSRHRWRAAVTDSRARSRGCCFSRLASRTAASTSASRRSSIRRAESVRTAQGDRQRVELWRAGLATPRRTRSPASVSEISFRSLLIGSAAWRASRAMLSRRTFRCSARRGLLVALALLLLLGGLGRDLARGLRRERALYAGLAGALRCRCS